jgi:FlaA1/EpsC-like NDP-sugar epimerase
MYRQLRNPKLYIMLVSDALLFALSLYVSYALRFDFDIHPVFLGQLRQLLPLMVSLKLLCFLVFGLYRGMWRYTDLRDSWALLQANLLASLGAIAAITYWTRFAGFPRSVFVIDFFLSFILTGGMRAGIRTMYLHKGGLQAPWFRMLPGFRRMGKDARKILIIGAGDAGEKLLREIIENPDLNHDPLGFLDDDPDKRFRSIHGVQVLGGIDELPDILAHQRIDEVFIAIPTATGRQVRRIVETCEKAGVEFKTLPGMGEIIEGRVSVNQLREVRYADLLGREPVELETEAISEILRGKQVLVTGAGGSIGSELCRQIIKYKPAMLVLVDASEANLYGIQMELHHGLGFTDYRTVLGKVQDEPLMRRVFQEAGPDIVFHAAAYKHVPMLEDNPWEAVIGNILGSRTVMEVSRDHGVGRFVLVSTDKAVRPTNVMGASKRATEIIMQSMNSSQTRFMAVRFGNVVGSSGSVIPLFKKQIAAGGPVTVTHPDVTRYFMTIEEASKLILQAGSMGRGGEIFILDMGVPVKIASMAEDLIRLSGKEPGEDVEIEFIGMRPGEKLYEELITEGENIVETSHEKILVLETGVSDFGFSGPQEFARSVEGQITDLARAAAAHDGQEIRTLLRAMVRDYFPAPKNSEPTGS